MQILDNIIILSLPVLAFIAGKRISDKYYQKILSHTWAQGYPLVEQPKTYYIGQQFMDRLHKNGRATQALDKHSPTPQPAAGGLQ